MSELRRKVLVKDLQFGMYVFQLDRPWTETPFPFQGFTLRNEQQLEMLQKYCQHVLVDQERSDAVLQPQFGPAVGVAQSSTGPLPGTRRIAHVERVTVDEELAPARDARTHAETRISDVFQTVKAGGALDAVPQPAGEDHDGLPRARQLRAEVAAHAARTHHRDAHHHHPRRRK